MYGKYGVCMYNIVRIIVRVTDTVEKYNKDIKQYNKKYKYIIWYIYNNTRGLT